MITLFRKCCHPISTCCQFHFSCVRGGVRPSIFNLGMFQQDVRGKTDAIVTNNGGDIVIRSLTHADLPQLMGVLKLMKYIDSESCFHSWLKTDADGIKVATTGKDEIVGVCSAVKNGDGDDGFMFCGCFFVKPKYQKQGIGRMLWKSCYQHIGIRNAGLNSVPGKLEIYRDVGGFPIHDTRFTSIEFYTSSWPLDFSFLTNTPPPGIIICPFLSSHLPSIFAYDFKLIGFKRTTALALNLMEAGSRTLVAVRSDGACAGFGTVKVTCTGAVRVGPLYADGHEIADVLLRRLGEMMMHEQKQGFAFMTTSANHHAMQLMDMLEVGSTFECDRLYTNNKLDLDIDKVYGQFDMKFSPF